MIENISFEFIFTLPFTIFMFGMKYFGSLLVWVGIVVYVWTERINLWDSWCDLCESVYDRIKSLLNRR